jgi:hypothetical protein
MDQELYVHKLTPEKRCFGGSVAFQRRLEAPSASGRKAASEGRKETKGVRWYTNRHFGTGGEWFLFLFTAEKDLID